MRGERPLPERPIGSSVGSSPHARGTLDAQATGRDALRFIPACAGNADHVSISIRVTAVHPRMRGERCVDSGRLHRENGSSPHARGTLNTRPAVARHRRFIPACAGNANTSLIIRSRMPVHPRMRGERSALHSAGRVDYGSSPHARGTRDRAPGDRESRRFIPACAGNAELPKKASAGAAVHPRMRGERRFWADNGRKKYGSSPHARGTLRVLSIPVRRPRFIPACAGNASARLLSDHPRTVHPRMRGERVELVEFGFIKVGSSPHARGTQPAPLGRP